MKIIFVEDDKMINDNLRLLLQGEKGIDWVEGFDSAEEAIEQARWNLADVLISDIDLPGISGVDLISWTQLNHPRVTSMVFTIHSDRDTVFAAIKSGACGYLLKSSTPRELVESLWQLAEGGAPMTPKIARQVILDLQSPDKENSPPENQLTAREKEILLLVEKGLAYKEIADALNISPHTVHTHVKKIYEKVQADGRQAVLQKARRMGWI